MSVFDSVLGRGYLSPRPPSYRLSSGRRLAHPLNISWLTNALFIAPVLLFSVIAHEYAHGYAALKQGDTTARDLGRLTWNPIRHIDPFMTIILPIVLLVASGGRIALGGAKPVPVDPRNYRNYRRGDIIVSLAGVFANLVIAFACVALIVVSGLLGRSVPALEPTLGILQVMLGLGVELNFLLIAFNLIPIPPLDGSHVVKHLLPRSWAFQYERFGRYGLLVLILLLWSGGSVLDRWLAPALTIADRLIQHAQPFILKSASQWSL